jgi:hypothetical protein
MNLVLFLQYCVVCTETFLAAWCWNHIKTFSPIMSATATLGFPAAAVCLLDFPSVLVLCVTSTDLQTSCTFFVRKILKFVFTYLESLQFTGVLISP